MPSKDIRPWQEIHAAKKAEQLNRIPKEWILSPKSLPSKEQIDLRPIAMTSEILSEREQKITGTEYDATSLAAAIAEGTYSAVDVVTAFCKRAAIGQQLLNNLTEICFLDAIEDAKKLDKYFAETGETVGPLHGLPMTFKECFHIKGYDATNGYISRAFNPSTYTTYLCEVVKDAGAVIIAKTNTPQTMLVAECDNNVFGRTKNPIVSHLTCGGSSGGEGSNMAFRGSVLGIGTDVGGSIRCPASVCGTYGYKPTFGLFPMITYAASNWLGMNTGIPAVAGPLANSARDLGLLTKVIRAAKPWLVDPSVIPFAMEQETSTRKPVVGIIHQSGLTPHPPVRRAMREAEAKLRDAGFQVREFNSPSFAEIRKITEQLFTIDGLSCARAEIQKSGEPLVPSVKGIGFWNLPVKTPEETWSWNAKKLVICKEILDEWQRIQCDVVISPAGAHTAVKPDDYTSEMYTVVWNAVDFPACIIPYTTVDPDLDPIDNEFKPLSAQDAAIQMLYDPELLAGAPVAIQIAGPRMGDAQLLVDVETIDAVLNS